MAATAARVEQQPHADLNNNICSQRCGGSKRIEGGRVIHRCSGDSRSVVPGFEAGYCVFMPFRPVDWD